MKKQHTLAGSFTIKGKGLHTGVLLTAVLEPAPENFGYKFQRIDLEGEPVIDAVAEHVVETTRGTVLQQGSARVSTVEHMLGALYALGVDNCLIKVNGPEVPILDGSAAIYVEEIQKVGLAEQEAERTYHVITEPLEVHDETTGSSLKILPAEEFQVEATISFNSKVLANQVATMESTSVFAKEIASARTFCFIREVEMLVAAGLIKGGDLNNAIVIYENQTTQEKLDSFADAIGAPHHDATQLGYLQTKPLVWDNEPARHKLLDVIGDMALTGKPLKGKIVAFRPGHTINNSLARLIRSSVK